MKIKKRTISTTITPEAAVSMLTKATSGVDFASFEAKPKEPLPAPRFTGFGRELGQLALGCRNETGDSAADGGFNAGDYVQMLRTPNDPKNMTEVRYRNRVRNRATGITAMCVDCAGTRKGVTECAAVECALWSFRLGGNPFRRRK